MVVCARSWTVGHRPAEHLKSHARFWRWSGEEACLRAIAEARAFVAEAPPPVSQCLGLRSRHLFRDRLLCRACDLDLPEIAGFRKMVRHSLGLGINPGLAYRYLEGEKPELPLKKEVLGHPGTRRHSLRSQTTRRNAKCQFPLNNRSCRHHPCRRSTIHHPIQVAFRAKNHIPILNRTRAPRPPAGRHPIAQLGRCFAKASAFSERTNDERQLERRGFVTSSGTSSTRSS
ncbi:hypothetical protein HNP83_000008 [Rhizobium leguminosarum]|nr:hypothetical protein [Rhizobium leguminosarum]